MGDHIRRKCKTKSFSRRIFLHVFYFLILTNKILVFEGSNLENTFDISNELANYFGNFKQCAIHLISARNQIENNKINLQNFAIVHYVKYFHSQLIPCMTSDESYMLTNYNLGKNGFNPNITYSDNDIDQNLNAVETKKRKLPVNLKFSGCLVQIYDDINSVQAYVEFPTGDTNNTTEKRENDDNDELSQKYRTMYFVLKGFLFSKRFHRPNYIVFLKLNVEEEHEDQITFADYYFYGNLFWMLPKPMFHVISQSPSSTQLYQVCLHCAGFGTGKSQLMSTKSRRILYKLKPNYNESSLRSQWNSLHANMNGIGIGTYTPSYGKYNPELRYELCSGGGSGFINPFLSSLRTYLDCTYSALVEKLNITILYEASSDLEIEGIITYATMHPRALVDQDLFNEVLSPFTEDLHWITTAEEFASFSFIVIVDKNQLNFSIFWRPFDSFIWLLYLMAFVAVPVCTFGFSCRKLYPNSPITSQTFFQVRSRSINAATWMSLSIILEQCQQSVIKVVSRGYKVGSIIVLTVWLLLNVTLDSAYKAKLFSLLSTSIIPTVPTTLTELTQPDSIDKYFIGSTSTALGMNNNVETRESALKVGILQNLMANNKNFPKAYKALYDNVIHLPIPHYIIVYSQLFESNLMDRVRNSSGNADNEDLTIPTSKDIVFVDKIQDLKFIGTLFDSFGPNLIVVYTKPIDAFNMRIPWLITDNYIEPFVSSALRQLQESGIYDRWQLLFEKNDIQLQLKAISNLGLYESDGQSLLSKHEHSRPYKRFTDESTNSRKDPKPLSFDMFQVILILFACCITFSILTFVIEVIHGCSLCFSLESEFTLKDA